MIGGGTIDRRDLQNALFNGKALDELPPIVIVVKDPETGIVSCIEDGNGFRMQVVKQLIRWPRIICSVWVTS